MVPQQVSFVERLSLSQMVPYRRFHCICTHPFIQELSGGAGSVAPSREVVVKTQTQTDFSSECHQKTVVFTHCGDRVVTGGSDGVVRVWKVSLFGLL